MTKHTAILQSAVFYVNAEMSSMHKAMGMEWELCGSQLVIRHLHARTPDKVYYGHYDVIDYGDDHVILVWVDEEGPHLGGGPLFDVTSDRVDAVARVAMALEDIQLPDLA